MVLADKDIKIRLSKGDLSITPLTEPITESSINIHLDNTVQKQIPGQNIDLRHKKEVKFETFKIDEEEGLIIQPNELYVVRTLENITIPNDLIGWIENSGSNAAIGLQIHFCDAHIDPGFSGKITLQLKNNSINPIRVFYKSYIAKLYIFEMTQAVSMPFSAQ